MMKKNKEDLPLCSGEELMQNTPAHFGEAEPDAHKRWMSLQSYLSSHVIGQEEAMDLFAGALLAGEMGHTMPGRPRSFLLFQGPTGVGKTKAAQRASSHLFGTGQIARINMAEYQNKEDLHRLLGESRSEQGYLGDQIDRLQGGGGRIILFDEIEKAHRDVSNIILGMEEAQITMSNGVTKNLEGFHIIATTNLGAMDAMEMEALPYEALCDQQEQEAMSFFKPEVLGRFTERIVFRQLTFPTQVEICRHMLAEELEHQSTVLGVPITADTRVFNYLVQAGFHEKLGARPMRNVIERRMRRALVDFRLTTRACFEGSIEIRLGMRGLVAEAKRSREERVV